MMWKIAESIRSPDWKGLQRAALQPIDAASLAVFRIGLGLCVAYDALRKGDDFFNSNDGKPFQFFYEGFQWVPSAGAWGPTFQSIWLIAAILVTIGLLYRPAMIVVTALTIFGFLQSQEYYLNHYYLLIILSFLMCWVPANREFAFDPYVMPERWKPAALRKMHLWLLKGQAEIVLIYAGLVKINSDWLHLEPLRSWLLKRHEGTIFDPLWQTDWGMMLAAYGVIILHVFGAPLLFYKRTRLPIAIIYTAFHISNHFTFDIGIFPWMTIALTSVFFDPHWPRRLITKLAGAARSKLTFPAGNVGFAMEPNWQTRGFLAFSAVWLFLQATIPLRHYAYPGDVAWTFEGHHFSWRMKLVDRWSPGLVAMAYVPEKNVILVPPLKHMMSQRQYDKATTRPPLARQVGPQVAKQIRARTGAKDVQVHLYMPVGYNNREAVPLINPKVDLAKDVLDETHGYWLIRENDKPLRRLEEFSPEYQFPSFELLAEAMGMPKPASCKQNEEDLWVECEVTPSQKLSEAK